MNIINYVSLPDKCNVNYQLKTTNVLTAQTVISCALGFNPILGDPLMFWGNYENNPSFGLVKEL